MRTIAGILVLLLAWGAAAARAQETRKMEPVVVTATTVETPAEQLGATVSVISEEDFRTYHYVTVQDALRSVPGLDVRQSGSLGKTTSISIRGVDPTKVQVLIDGVRIASPTTGEAELSDIPPDLIDRIEIIRGPQSTLYGADAIGGVVNIITKKGQGPFSSFLGQELGNYDTFRSQTGFSGSSGRVDYAFGASHTESAGRSRNDDSDNDAVSGRIGLALPGESALAFILRYNRGETRLPVRFVDDSGVPLSPLPIRPFIDVNARQESETLVTSLDGRTHPVPWWGSELRLSRYENTVGFQDPQDPGIPCFFLPCDTISQIDVERREAEWVNHFYVGAWSTSSIGLLSRGEDGDVSGNSPGFSKRTSTEAAWVEQQVRVLERLFLTGGARVEHHSVFGTEATGRGSAAFVIKETGTRLRASGGSGFRAPTFNELYFPGFGDPSLKAEHSVSFDAGLDQRLWANRVRLALTYFENHFKDLIVCCVPSPRPPNFVAFTNAGRANTGGLEFASEADLLDSLTAHLNYTYTETKDVATGRWLPRVPRHSWEVGLTWTPTRRASLFAQVYAVTRQWETLGGVYNSGHTRVDVGGQYRLVERAGRLQALDLTLRVQNLLNEGYAEVRGFPALGTAFLVGLRASF
jgi:vitamin B12 transporter